jgi:hypothetical protein
MCFHLGERMSFFGKGQGRKSVMIHTTFSHACFSNEFYSQIWVHLYNKNIKRGYFKLCLFINHVFGFVNNTRKHILVTSVGKQ